MESFLHNWGEKHNLVGAFKKLPCLFSVKKIIHFKGKTLELRHKMFELVC